jgi:hypothetical protein
VTPRAHSPFTTLLRPCGNRRGSASTMRASCAIRRYRIAAPARRLRPANSPIEIIGFLGQPLSRLGKLADDWVSHLGPIYLGMIIALGEEHLHLICKQVGQRGFCSNVRPPDACSSTSQSDGHKIACCSCAVSLIPAHVPHSFPLTLNSGPLWRGRRMVSANLAMSDHPITCEVARIGRRQGPTLPAS